MPSSEPSLKAGRADAFDKYCLGNLISAISVWSCTAYFKAQLPRSPNCGWLVNRAALQLAPRSPSGAKGSSLLYAISNNKVLS